MRRSSELSLISMAALLASSWSAAQNASTQVSTSAGPQAQVEMTSLFPPVYPPLARQARIMGDVIIQLEIRRDGSVETAEVVSGHRMLKQAALESARQSHFECKGCTGELTPLLLTYSFGIREDGGCCCDVERLRAAKCLYLWKCGGWREIGRRPPALSHWLDHVTILADGMCVETATSGSD